MGFARRGSVLRQLDLLFGTGTAAGSTDGELIGRFVAGRDESSFSALVARHGPMVIGVCRSVLRSRHDAEDAFQATFLILAKKAATLRKGDSLAGWLQRVAHRVAVQAALERTRRQQGEHEAAAHRADEPERDVPWNELLGPLHEEIGRLPEKYRAPIVLCDLESMTRDQAAGLLGWPPGTVAGRLARGRNLLRDRLTRRGLTSEGAIGGLLLSARSASASVPQAWIDTTVTLAVKAISAGAVPAQVLGLAEGVLKAMARAQLRKSAAILLLGSTLSGLIAAAVLAGGADSPTVTYEGAILDAQGRPAAGAEVVLSEGSPWLRDSPSSFTIVPAVLPDPAILGRERADAAGRFRIVIPPVDSDLIRRYRPLNLWAWLPGQALELRTIPNGWPADGEPADLRFRPPTPIVVQVEGPDGKPVAGARLAPARMKGKRLPTELAGAFGVATNEAGRGVLEAVAAPDELDLIRVEASGFGTQLLVAEGPDDAGVRRLKLSPVGRVEGVLSADDEAAIRGVEVRLLTRTDRSDRNLGAGGTARVVTDEHGRFSVPAIAAGEVAVAFRPHPELPFLGWFNATPTLQAGGTTRLEIPLQRAARVQGSVRDRDSGAPIAGALVSLDANRDTPFARTDAEGRYVGYALPGRLQARVASVPSPYHIIDFRVVQEIIPEGAREYTARPRLVARGSVLEGKVVDPRGRGVPTATVSAEWLVPNASLGQGVLPPSVTDRNGAFRIELIDSKAEVMLSARRDELATAAPVSARAGQGPVTLRLEPGHLAALVGRVVDVGGRPLAGVPVRLESRKLDPASRSLTGMIQLVAFDDAGITPLRTDAEGRFSTPQRLPTDWAYRASVEGPGRVQSQTNWLEPTRSRAFPDLIVRPASATVTVAGRVVDSAGGPVAGAVVFQSGDGPVGTRTKTDGDGQFKLDGVYRGPALLFVERSGFRFAGHRVEASDQAVILRVLRDAEPAGQPLRTLSPPLPWQESQKLALRLLEDEGLARQVKQEPNARRLERWLAILARLDFPRALELLETGRRADARANLLLRFSIANELTADSADNGAALTETIEPPAVRWQFYRKQSDRLPRTERERKLELLEQSLRYALTWPTPFQKIVALGTLGVCFLESGEVERGTELLREAQRVVETLPKPRPVPSDPTTRARLMLAGKLARIDEAGALALIEGAEGAERDRALMGVALGLAERHPEGAERALGQIADPIQRRQAAPRVAARIAVNDLPRARRLADGLKEPESRAIALAMMARSLADAGTEARKRAAIALVDEVTTALIALDDEGRNSGRDVEIALPVSLLPLAERLDPELLQRTFWRAASFRPARPPGGDPEGKYETKVAILAGGLARYDRDVARLMLDPIADRASAIYAERGYTFFKALAAVDPARALALLDTLPDDPPDSRSRFKSAMRLAIAEVLSFRTSALWDELEAPFVRAVEDSHENEY